MGEQPHQDACGDEVLECIAQPPESRFLLTDILQQSGKTVLVSLVGAGGKTSTLYWLAKALSQQKLRVLVTTTTAMSCTMPDWLQTRVQYAHSVEVFMAGQGQKLQASDAPGLLALFSGVDQAVNKVKGYSPAEIDRLKALNVFDVILVEADGARGLQIKAAEAHEPQLPLSSDYVIGLTGFSVFADVIHPEQVHRWPLFCERFGVAAGQRLDDAFFSRYLTDPFGLFKAAPAQAQKHWVLNACPQADKQTLARVKSLAMTHPWLKGVWLTQMQEADPFLYAWLRSSHH